MIFIGIYNEKKNQSTTKIKRNKYQIHTQRERETIIIVWLLLFSSSSSSIFLNNKKLWFWKWNVFFYIFESKNMPITHTHTSPRPTSIVYWSVFFLSFSFWNTYTHTHSDDRWGWYIYSGYMCVEFLVKKKKWTIQWNQRSYTHHGCGC